MADDQVNFSRASDLRKQRLAQFASDATRRLRDFTQTPESADGLRSQTEYMVDALNWVREEAAIILSQIRSLGE